MEGKDTARRVQRRLNAHFRDAEKIVKRIERLGGDGALARETLAYYEGLMYAALPPEPDKTNVNTILA